MRAREAPGGPPGQPIFTFEADRDIDVFWQEDADIREIEIVGISAKDLQDAGAIDLRDHRSPPF